MASPDYDAGGLTLGPAEHQVKNLCLQILGDWVLRPFLQDTIQFWPLTAAMAGTLLSAPVTIGRVLVQVRPGSIMFHDWQMEA